MILSYRGKQKQRYRVVDNVQCHGLSLASWTMKTKDKASFICSQSSLGGDMMMMMMMLTTA